MLYIVLYFTVYSMARTNNNLNDVNGTPRDSIAATTPPSAGAVRVTNATGSTAANQNNHNNMDISSRTSTNQPRSSIINGPKQLPLAANGAKHNHLNNHYDETKVRTYLYYDFLYI